MLQTSQANPSSNKCDGYVTKTAYDHGYKMSNTLCGFRGDQGMSTGVQKGYAGLRALLVSTPRSHPGCFDAEWNPFDAMSSALWLMEAHGRKWSVPQDNATAIRHLEYFQKSSLDNCEGYVPGPGRGHLAGDSG